MKASRIGGGGRVLRVEPLENRDLLSGLSFEWLTSAIGQFCGPLRPSQLSELLGSTVATSTLLTDKAGTLYAYNASQGAAATAQEIGSTGVAMQDLAFAGSGAYYGVDAPSPSHENTSALYGIGFTTNPPGNVQVVQKGILKATTGDTVNLNSLAYADGALWAAGSVATPGGDHYLFKIDTSTFAITDEWPLSVASGTLAGTYKAAGDIEFSGTTGYITTTDGPLLSFNTSNPGSMSARQYLDTNNQPITDFQGLAYGRFSATNMLLAFREGSNNTYWLNRNTNQWQQYGALGSMFPGNLQGASGMSGTVSSVEAPAPDIKVVGKGLFGVGLEGLPGLKRTFFVHNKGNEPLMTEAVTLPEGFVITEGLDEVIPPHSCDTFTVQLVTDTPGTFEGDMLIGSNDSDGQVAIPLRGTVIGLNSHHFLPWTSTLTKVQERAESVANQIAKVWATVDAIHTKIFF